MYYVWFPLMAINGKMGETFLRLLPLMAINGIQHWSALMLPFSGPRLQHMNESLIAIPSMRNQAAQTNRCDADKR
jgi:hypothetical protein